MKQLFLFIIAVFLFYNHVAAASQPMTESDAHNSRNKNPSALKVIQPKGVKMNATDISDRYRDIKPEKMPSSIKTTTEEDNYIAMLIDSMIDVLAGKRILKEHDEDFGAGKYFWPKDPSKPTKNLISYDAENFKIRKITINFMRNTQSDPWCNAEILLFPKNFPKGVFQMNLSSSSLMGIKLNKAYREQRPNEQIKDLNIFTYELSSNSKLINLTFETKFEISKLDDLFPKSFHKLVLKINGIACTKL